MKVKVRIAPSPTGFLHVGTAQSALYNWLFARKHEGTFYLRIEDTDKERSTKEYEQAIYDSLEWLGLKWDRDVVRQSDRMDKYKAVLEKLLSEGKAFYCHHSKEELEEEKKQQAQNKQPPLHDCEHKNTEEGKTPGGLIRLAIDRNPERKIVFDDIIRGRVEFEAKLMSDVSLGNGFERLLYNFTTVIDDIDMKISHVIRGEDHISNTPKQILLYEALGKQVPQFAHLPLILAPDRSKLSKRHGATAVVDYKKDYLPEALLNFLGAMSYTFGEEILTKEEMVKEFELAKVHKSGAVFNIDKLNWFNSQYIKKLDPAKFKELTNIDVPDKAVPLITERLEKLSDAHGFDYFWKEPEYDKELLKWKKADSGKSLETLSEVQKIIENFDFNKEKEELRKVLDEFSAKIGDRGLVYWPLRVALTGKEKSPDPVELAVVLGKKEVVKRIGKALTFLK